MAYSPSLPPWPVTAPAHGGVVLRRVSASDVAMAQELSTDPYVPTVASLPANATGDQALAWVHRQEGRHRAGAGFSFAIADLAAGTAIGHCGLWLWELADGRGTAGYSVAPSARRPAGAGSPPTP
ncbi:GNAT family N-acetyltransferase [Georgenia sp. MJ173]|uniref:GNAT family N-acetyltransferase n=1 Tax=Georgenia sunbinii TaxID=3117728 RepID=UPI002F26B1BA